MRPTTNPFLGGLTCEHLRPPFGKTAFDSPKRPFPCVRRGSPGAGAKGDKAASLGVDVWSEADFLAALGGGGGGTKAGGKKAAASKKRAAPAASKKSAAKKAKSSKWLAGATFCLTGTLSMSRAEITAKIKAAGGAVRPPPASPIVVRWRASRCGPLRQG